MKIAQKRVLFLSLVFLCFFSWIFWQEYKKVTQTPINSWTEDLSLDCAIVLTGGANRVRTGLDLLSRKQIKKLVVSGVYENATLREIFPLWPVYGELDEKDVVLERRSLTTFGNAQQTVPIVEALNCREVAVVTSNLHMYRAFKTFQASYPETILLKAYSVNPGRSESGLVEIWTEVLKSLFYELWAY